MTNFRKLTQKVSVFAKNHILEAMPMVSVPKFLCKITKRLRRMICPQPEIMKKTEY